MSIPPFPDPWTVQELPDTYADLDGYPRTPGQTYTPGQLPDPEAQEDNDIPVENWKRNGTLVVTPSITSLTPATGAAAGGGAVTIAGTYLYDGLTHPVVKIDDTAVSASAVTVNSPTSLKVSPWPAGSAGQVDITVTTSGGTSDPATYTYT